MRSPIRTQVTLHTEDQGFFSIRQVENRGEEGVGVVAHFGSRKGSDWQKTEEEEEEFQLRG
jgi:hypothetical protein